MGKSLRSLMKPVGYGSWDCESFETYEKRCAPLLPNFPTDVLETWIYRHHSDAFSDYGWIGFKTLIFEKQSWPTHQILQQISASDERMVNGWAFQLQNKANFRRSWLGAYMINNGTWPVMPVVINNLVGLQKPNGEALTRFHLAEGHHRLPYLRALVENPEWTAKDEHQIWQVTPKS